MKITIDFDDLFSEYDSDTETSKNALTKLKEEIDYKVVEYVASRVGWQLGYYFDESFKEFKDTTITRDDFRDLATVIINKYKEKIKKDIRKVLLEEQ